MLTVTPPNGNWTLDVSGVFQKRSAFFFFFFDLPNCLRKVLRSVLIQHVSLKLGEK